MQKKGQPGQGGRDRALENKTLKIRATHKLVSFVCSCFLRQQQSRQVIRNRKSYTCTLQAYASAITTSRRSGESGGKGESCSLRRERTTCLCREQSCSLCRQHTCTLCREQTSSLPCEQSGSLSGGAANSRNLVREALGP